MRRRGPKKLFAANRFGQIQERLGRAAFDLHRLAALFQRGRRFGRDHGHRLAQIQHFAVGQKRLVRHDEAEHVVARHIGHRVAPDDAGNRERRARIDAQQLARRDRTADEADVQLAGQRAQIVDVRRLAGHMAERPNHAARFSNAGHRAYSALTRTAHER